MNPELNKLIIALRDFLFVDKARSEREYQRVKYCIEWCIAFTNDHLCYPYSERIFCNPNDPREVLYDNLYDIPRLVEDFYEENRQLKARVKRLEEINKALLENTKVVILTEELP